MIDFKNNTEAFDLAVTKNFVPPLPVYPSKRRVVNSGKFEPDNYPCNPTRCMVLAHFSGATNILIKYFPSEL